MTRSVHDAHFTALHVAQETRRAQPYGPETKGEEAERSMSGGVESRHAAGKIAPVGPTASEGKVVGADQSVKCHNSRPAKRIADYNAADEAGVAPGPLTTLRAKADTETSPVRRIDHARAASSPLIPTLTDAIYERDVLRVVLVALRLHPKVSWVERMNAGKFKLPGKDGREQWVRFGFKGMADITGQLRDGRRLECECKRPGEQATADQAAFLQNVRNAGGVAFVARGVDDVMRELA